MEPPKQVGPEIIRERPPILEKIPTQEIILPGRVLPPPKRRIIIERPAKLPDETRGQIVERWLPYDQQERCVIFNKAQQTKPLVIDKNLEYIWDEPNVYEKTKHENLGCEIVDPNSYLGIE